ncbi:MAG: ABC transporter permease subunit [Clostridia bacterium]|nr:ABC transporter permease subunit [Clostridia bacterium]
MKDKLKSILIKVIFPLIFWLSVWQILAELINHKFLLPGIPDTLSALGALLGKESFYVAIFLSLLRVIAGLIIGIALGSGIAFLCNYSSVASALILPIISVIKSTPVASFIVVLWVMMSGDALSIVIGVLMVMPIITQNLLDGFGAIDPRLAEVADIFEMSRSRRLRLLILPSLRRYFIPGVITSVGLAWKAEIAAEIIAYTKRSIGQGINDAKYSLDTPTVFAWTMIIITFSIILEKCTKNLLGRWSK